MGVMRVVWECATTHSSSRRSTDLRSGLGLLPQPLHTPAVTAQVVFEVLATDKRGEIHVELLPLIIRAFGLAEPSEALVNDVVAKYGRLNLAAVQVCRGPYGTDEGRGMFGLAEG